MRGSISTQFRHGLMATAAIVCVAQASSAQAQERAFDVPAQEAAAGVAALARQADAQILISARDAKGKRTNAVNGAMTTEAALDALLKDTGLEARLTAPRTWAVVRMGAPGESVAAGGGGRERVSSYGDDAVPEGGDADRSEIVVTGTKIKGGNAGAPLTVIDRKQIERTGYASTAQLVESLPQNFKGGALGASEDALFGPSGGAQVNFTNATGVNLRGLGNSSTLTLLNGHRMAPTARGQTVDVSLIPLNAIERVEILTDGSSAIYGSDAIAGVVNFILRGDFDGAESRMQLGTVTEGELTEFSASQFFGRTWTDGGGIVGLSYRYRGALSSDDRSFTDSVPEPADILPATKAYSGMVHLDHALTSDLRLSLDGLASWKRVKQRATQDFTDFGFGLATREFDVETFSPSLNLSADYTFIGDWTLSLTGGLASESDDSVVHANDVALAISFPGYESGTPYIKNDYHVLFGDLTANGTLFRIAGRPFRVAVGTSWRQEKFKSVLPSFDSKESLKRTVRAAFAEINFPILREQDRIPAFRRLIVSAAARYDDYSDFGDTFNPQVGVLWSPISSLDLRASYSSSFRAPNVQEVLSTRVPFFQAVSVRNLILPDGSRGPAVRVTGSESSLQPETAKSWTVGFRYRPKFFPRSSLSFNRYSIDFRNRIVSPPIDALALTRPDIYGSLITVFNSEQEVLNFINSRVSQGATFSNTTGAPLSSIRYAINLSQQNAAIVKQSGFDVSAQTSFDIGSNTFDANLSLSYIDRIKTYLASNSVPVDVVDTYANPLRLRFRGDLGWSRGPWLLNGAINFSGAYRDISVEPERGIKSWTTVDLAARYTPRMMRGLSVGISALNVFDNNPPFVVGQGTIPVHYDVGNATPLGRFISADIRFAL